MSEWLEEIWYGASDLVDVEREPVVEDEAAIESMVPVVHWDAEHLWLFVKSPKGSPVLTQMKHKNVLKYAKILTAPGGAWQYKAKLNPKAYVEPGDLYPIDWVPGGSKALGTVPESPHVWQGDSAQPVSGSIEVWKKPAVLAKLTKLASIDLDSAEESGNKVIFSGTWKGVLPGNDGPTNDEIEITYFKNYGYWSVDYDGEWLWDSDEGFHAGYPELEKEIEGETKDVSTAPIEDHPWSEAEHLIPDELDVWWSTVEDHGGELFTFQGVWTDVPGGTGKKVAVEFVQPGFWEVSFAGEVIWDSDDGIADDYQPWFDMLKELPTDFFKVDTASVEKVSSVDYQFSGVWGKDKKRSAKASLDLKDKKWLVWSDDGESENLWSTDHGFFASPETEWYEYLYKLPSAAIPQGSAAKLMSDGSYEMPGTMDGQEATFSFYPQIKEWVVLTKEGVSWASDMWKHKVKELPADRAQVDPTSFKVTKKGSFFGGCLWDGKPASCRYIVGAGWIVQVGGETVWEFGKDPKDVETTPTKAPPAEAPLWKKFEKQLPDELELYTAGATSTTTGWVFSGNLQAPEGLIGVEVRFVVAGDTGYWVIHDGKDEVWNSQFGYLKYLIPEWKKYKDAWPPELADVDEVSAKETPNTFIMDGIWSEVGEGDVSVNVLFHKQSKTWQVWDDEMEQLVWSTAKKYNAAYSPGTVAPNTDAAAEPKNLEDLPDEFEPDSYVPNVGKGKVTYTGTWEGVKGRAVYKKSQDLWSVYRGRKKVWDSKEGYVTVDPDASLTAVSVLSSNDLPSLAELEVITGAGDALPGAGKKEVYQDKDGKQYIWKPAIPKSGTASEPFRATAQAAFASIATAVRPNHIPISLDKKGDQTGTLQPVLELDDAPIGNPEDLTDQEKTDVASEHVLDWLMSQHDTHKGNLVRTKDGRILSVDKEQGWKYFDSDRLSTEYHPNEKYGEQPPFYNMFWKAFAEGSMEFDPQALSGIMDRLDKVSGNKMLETAYVHAQVLYPEDKQAYEREQFVRKTVSRKATLRADFEEFVTGLYRERTGEAGKFTFKGGWKVDEGGPEYAEVTASGPDLAVKLLGPKALKAHNTDSSLFLIRVPMSESMGKVRAFAESLGLEVKQELHGSAYNSVVVDRKAFHEVTQTKKVKVEKEGGVAPYLGDSPYGVADLTHKEQPPNVDRLSKMETLPSGARGHAFTLDGKAVEQQTASVQRVIMPGEDEPIYRVHFKLRQGVWKGLSGETQVGQHHWYSGSYDSAIDAVRLSSHSQEQTSAKIWDFPQGDRLYVAVDLADFSYAGSVYAYVGSDSEGGMKKRLAVMLDKVGLKEEILRVPTGEETLVYRLSQALWSVAPQVHDKLTPEDYTSAVLRKKLNKHLSRGELSAIREVEVAEGKQSVAIPGRHRKIMYSDGQDDPVFLYAFWQVKEHDVSKVPSFLRSGGACIHDRLRMGLPKAGASVQEDIQSGGADATTLRVAVRGTRHEQIPTGVPKGPIQFIVSPQILDRLDVHFTMADGFGCMSEDSKHYKAYKSRKPLDKSFQALSNSPVSTHEIVIRKGFHASKIVRIVAQTEGLRAQILKTLQEAGVTSHNGCPIEEFVVVETTKGAVYDKYVKPLGF